MTIINQPFFLFMIPVVAGSLTLMGLVVKYHRAVGTWISRCWKVAWKKLATKAAFFWFVNLVFMAVSVLHAGLFFALLEPAKGLLGLAPLLGFAVALTLDLASIVFMQARLSALRMHEQRSAGWYLFSIIACSGLSAFGNLAMSLQDFQPGSLNHAGRLIQAISPWLGVAFPLLIILISIASDKVLDVDPTEHLDVEAYRKLEQKRIAILVERNTFLEQQVEQDRRREDIKRREKDSKRRKRGPSPETTPPSPTELEQVMARFETLQEQVRKLSLASPALVNGQQEPVIVPPPPETAPMHLLGGQIIHQQQELRHLTVEAPNELEDRGSFEVHVALNSLDQHPALKQQVLDLSHQDPQTALTRIATLMKQQDGLAGVTPLLVSQMLTRLVPSTHNGHLTQALVNSSVNTVSDTGVDATRSGEKTADGYQRETIPTTDWRAEGAESEQAFEHTSEAAQPSLRPHTGEQKSSLPDEPHSTQRTAAASDFKQELHLFPGGMGNGEVFPGRGAEERWRVHEEDPRHSVHGHLEGQDRDPLVNTSPDTVVNRRASAGTHHIGNTEQMAGGQWSEHLAEHPGEQEEHADAPLNVNSAVNTQAPTFPSTSVNGEANTLVTIPTRTRAPTAAAGIRPSGKGQGRADKPRGEASQRVRRVLKKYPALSITRLAEKANVSRGYASQVRAQVFSEQQRDTFPGA